MAEASDVELVVDAHAIVAEGPIWDPATNRLVWIDIMNSLVYRYDPASGENERWDVGQHVGAAALRDSGGMILAVRDGFATLDLDSGQVTMVADVEKDIPTNRMNDGKCDTSGRFWAGTMSYEPRANPGAGTLYRLDPDGTVETMVKDVTISNGIGWSPDDRLMYYVDSLSYRLDVFDYDAASGAIQNRRPLVTFGPGDGVPDGLTVDVDGYVWVALFGGWQVRRYAPDGRLDRTVRVPASNVTSASFGGPEMTNLYITTATEGLDEQALREQPHAGGLFRYPAGVKGLPPQTFKG